MPRPTLDELTKQIPSKYTLTVLVAKRASQLKDLSDDKSVNLPQLLNQALQEVMEGKISYKLTKPEEKEAEPAAEKKLPKAKEGKKEGPLEKTNNK